MTVVATASDQELVAATRGGDDRAFEELYARYRKRLIGYCLQFTQDSHRADDIAQEVFISALRGLRESDRPVVFRPWIYEIARNACIDEHRRRSRVREIPIERDGEMAWSGRSAPPPEVVVESKQQLDDLRGAFRGLSERHHQIIVLREFEGLSYSQIGDRLGVSKMVVESTLFRARRRLTQEYEDLASGRRCEQVLGLLGGQEVVPRKRLGLKDRRALAQHLEHCASCRREALVRGQVDGAARTARHGLAGKVAVLLPFPLLRLPGRLFGRAVASGRGAVHAALPAGLSVARYSEGAMTFVESGRAAVTAATLLAAVGGGLVTGLGVQGDSSPSAARSVADASLGNGSARAATGASASRAAVPGAVLSVWAQHGRGDFGLVAGPGGSLAPGGSVVGGDGDGGGAAHLGSGGVRAGTGTSDGGSRGRLGSGTGTGAGLPGSGGLLSGSGASGGGFTSPTGGLSGSAGGLSGAAGGLSGATTSATGAAGQAATAAAGTVGTLGSSTSTSAPGSGSLSSTGTPSVPSAPSVPGLPSGSSTVGSGTSSGAALPSGSLPSGPPSSTGAALPGSSSSSGSSSTGGSAGGLPLPGLS